LKVHVVPRVRQFSSFCRHQTDLSAQDAMVTMDFREDRVRIFVDEEGKVVRPPRIG
jgi:hypothetical protein